MKTPPFLTRRRAEFALTEIAFERLAALGARTGLSRNRTLDMLVRGVDEAAALEAIADRLSSDVQAQAAWDEAGG